MLRIALIELALLGALALALLVLGRALTCPCGTVALWAGDIYSNQNSQQLTDPYTFTHVTHGMLFYGALRLLWPRGSFTARLALATVIEVLWEVAENSPLIIDRYRETTVALGYYGDSVLNSVSDVLFCIVGFVIASRISRRANVIAIVASEVILLLWIHDNLTLNVLMLLYPIPAIRAWQLG
ncbi:MAG: DUF2585 family protein [Dehalococcoidia bacterium]